MTSSVSQKLGLCAYTKEASQSRKQSNQVTQLIAQSIKAGKLITVAEAIELINAKAANDTDNTPEPEPTTIEFTREKVTELVSDGKFFNVQFVKRTTGELRTMQARMNVVKHLKGGVKQYDDKAKNLLTVFSMDANGYRSIPIDAIQFITAKGVTYAPAA